ncbi:hypothetical protein SNA_13960 [Streptomyces natalensis ATCC 27448]|uniref:Uncharacterized protein n=2 Tax=Streptomyces natalensis TaxID=68242 RepID=A0A0D7CQ88_9ACTN|nr:hypothetical protein SNA_13960 [Streptomyces natalensis ATCC 27448]
MEGVKIVDMANEMAMHVERLRDLEADIDALADAVGAPRERSITQRLDTIERVLFALARAQGIDPDSVS